MIDWFLTDLTTTTMTKSSTDGKHCVKVLKSCCISWCVFFLNHSVSLTNNWSKYQQSSLGLLLFLCVTSFHRNTRPPSHGCNLLKEVGQAASLEELHNRLSASRDLQKTQVDITMNQLLYNTEQILVANKDFFIFQTVKNEEWKVALNSFSVSLQ